MTTTRWRWWLAGAMAVVVAIGWVNLMMPFGGDQAMFVVGAKVLSNGGVLYRDFWDFKQPGLYWWYLTGGRIFGFTELGLHVWELFGWLAFALVLAWSLRSRLRHTLLAAAAPLAVAAYLGLARPQDIGQIEGLLAIPFFLALLAVDDSHGPVSRRRWFLSGLAGAAIVLLKYLYVVVPIAFWMRALIRAWRRGADTHELRGSVGALAVGLLLPLAPVVAYFTATGQLGTIWWTYFVFSPRTTALEGRTYHRLVSGARYILTGLAPFVLLALVAIYGQLRGRNRPLVTDLCSWLVISVPVLLLGGWWPYHFMVFAIPILVLAIFGLDELVDVLSRRQLVGALAIGAVLLLPLAIDTGRKVKPVAEHQFGVTADGRREIHEALDFNYRVGPSLTAFLHDPGARQGAIYVLGDPVFQLMSGRDQAIPQGGWNANVSDSELFRKQRDTLAAERPPYIFVDYGARQTVRERSVELDEFVQQRYHELQRNEVGIWYELNS